MDEQELIATLRNIASNHSVDWVSTPEGQAAVLLEEQAAELAKLKADKNTTEISMKDFMNNVTMVRSMKTGWIEGASTVLRILSENGLAMAIVHDLTPRKLESLAESKVCHIVGPSVFNEVVRKQNDG